MKLAGNPKMSKKLEMINLGITVDFDKYEVITKDKKRKKLIKKS